MLEELLLKNAQQYPSKTAIVYDKLRISYEELYIKVRGLSKGLGTIGIRPGDCIALILPNCPEFAIAFYATAKINAIALPLNHLFKEEEISYYISDSKPKAIITDLKRVDLCRNIIAKINQNIQLIIVDGIEPSTTYFYDLIVTEETKNYENATSESGSVLYQYSSGSTGKPKRIGKTQHNLYHEVKNFGATTNLNSTDNILCIVPLYHAHGLGNCLLAAICNGATLVILEQVLQQGNPVEVPFIFRRQRVLELLQSEKVTIFPAIPYIFNILADIPSDLEVDLSALRLCFSAGNFLTKEIFDKFLTRFKIPIRQLYGCTEAGSISINLDTNMENTYDSVGIPMKNVQVKILSDEEEELPVGKIGEVAIKSEALTSGYYNMPELNQQAFKDGWFLTGDLGKKDENSYLYITGRKKLLIDTGGYKVDPLEIEAILTTHPSIQEAVVVGVKQDDIGEIIKAAIVTKEGAKIEEKEIVLFCKERMTEFKIPKIIEFREEIPKSALGKILRKDLI
ncbi:class I adenylate-forming enzyme family protein [Aerosakkonema sp. BLCC-F183]|uniref:class I adenylate-forming enzyme family protein n=1 Tax=Aerosakkonema sp. BLCC-F183 TaxID=3342834 RepID=UPI0035BA097D